MRKIQSWMCRQGGSKLRNWKKLVAVAALLGLTFATPAMADDPDFFVIGGGWYDFNDNEEAFDFRAEYRSGYKVLGFIKPWAGTEIATICYHIPFEDIVN